MIIEVFFSACKQLSILFLETHLIADPGPEVFQIEFCTVLHLHLSSERLDLSNALI